MTQLNNAGNAELLSRIEFFKGCTPPEIDNIANLVVDGHFAAGQALCRQGDAETQAFALIEGEASVIPFPRLRAAARCIGQNVAREGAS